MLGKSWPPFSGVGCCQDAEVCERVGAHSVIVMVRDARYVAVPLRATGVVGAVNVAEKGVHVHDVAVSVYVRPHVARQ